MGPFAAALDRARAEGRPLVLDGASGTQLEALGADIGGGLWSARLLAEDPALVERMHAAYAAAGAQVIESVSYQASPRGLAAAGFTAAEARELLARSWELASRAAQEARRAGAEAFAAASIGPFGAYLADGSEYTGAYGADFDGPAAAAELEAFHRERIEPLYAAGARLFAIETIPRADEALAVSRVMADYPDAEWWLSFSLRPEGGGGGSPVRIAEGMPLADALDALDTAVSQPAAVAVNCCAASQVEPAMRAITAAGRHGLAYPNSGESYDAATGTWAPPASAAALTDPTEFAAAARDWAAAGASAVGGCCRTTPEIIAALARGTGRA